MGNVFNSRLTQVSTPTRPPRIYLKYLDGIRGLAALYVVASHFYFLESHWGGIPLQLIGITGWLDYGRVAVVVFILLSGYCLMLPVARSPDYALRAGKAGFMKRRARRILPTYYAALLLSLLVAVLFPALEKNLTPAYVLSHLLLLHNLREQWCFQINGPMWSIAVECQIYCAFAFVLLPVWRRFGPVVTVVMAFALTLVPHFLLGGVFDYTAPWYLGIFSLGMVFAYLSAAPDPRAQFLRRVMPSPLLACGSLALCVLLCTHSHAWYEESQVYLDPLIGIVTGSLILYCQQWQTSLSSDQPPILRLLESKWAVALGTFSYSLYLIHYLILELGHLLLLQFGIGEIASFWLLLFGAVPVAVAFAWGFFQIFEKPFVH